MSMISEYVSWFQYLVEEHPELQSLDVSSCKHVTPRLMQVVAENLRNLRHINVSGLCTNPASISALCCLATSNVSTLQRLQVAAHRVNWYFCSLFPSLCTMQDLRLLDISGAVLPETLTVMKAFAHLSDKLEVIRISGCSIRERSSDRDLLASCLSFQCNFWLSSFSVASPASYSWSYETEVG